MNYSPIFNTEIVEPSEQERQELNSLCLKYPKAALKTLNRMANQNGYRFIPDFSAVGSEKDDEPSDGMVNKQLKIKQRP